MMSSIFAVHTIVRPAQAGTPDRCRDGNLTAYAVQVASNKRYAAAQGKGFTVSECAKNVQADCGNIDIVVHSLANGPEVTKALLETSRKVGPELRCPELWTCMLRPGCGGAGLRMQAHPMLVNIALGVCGTTSGV